MVQHEDARRTPAPLARGAGPRLAPPNKGERACFPGSTRGVGGGRTAPTAPRRQRTRHACGAGRAHAPRARTRAHLLAARARARGTCPCTCTVFQHDASPLENLCRLEAATKRIKLRADQVL